MNLNELSIRHDATVVHVSPHGLAHVKADRMRGMIVEFPADEKEPLHYSIELHGASVEQLEAVLAALGGGR